MTNNKVHVKKGDTVFVRTGKDRGKQGKVMRVMPAAGRVLVEGLNMVKKHVKAGPKVKQAGILTQEAPLQASNVMVVCSGCNQPSRLGHTMADGKKVRVCRKCGEIVDRT